jgi:NAD-specific glutamate dehydrogenase
MTAGSYDAWVSKQAAGVGRVLSLLDDIRTHAVYDFATMSVALRELRALS